MTVNDDENFVAVTTNDFSRMISFREFPGDRIIMVECLVTDIDPGTYDPQDGFVKNIILKKVTVKLAIELRRELPSGTLSKDEKDGESYLAVVAESFGFPVSGHADEPFATLYSGPWDGKPLRIMNNSNTRPFYCIGIDKAKLECDMIWAFDRNRYLIWRDKSSK